MRSFGSSSFGRSPDPWFRVGNIDVSTTIAVIGFGVFSLFIWLIEGPTRSISVNFWLTSAVQDGEVWRIFTWPFFIEPGASVFWTILLYAIFYLLGSQLEARMGRRPYTIFLAALTIGAGVFMSVFQLITNISGGAGGLRYLELCVLVGFALAWPDARFWPGIPAWAIAAGIVAIDLLQSLADRDNYSIVMLLVIIGLALVLLRGMGFAEGQAWIPRVRLPTAFGADVPRSRREGRPSRARRKSNLKPVAPDPVQSDLADMEIDALLDQVANEGLDSLTKAQRKRLEDHSKRLRKRKD